MKRKKCISSQEELKDAVKLELDLLMSLDKEAKIEKNEDIKSMIRYYISMTDKIEDRRTHIYDFTLQMLAICITALGICITSLGVLSSNNYPKIYLALLWIIVIVLFVQIVFMLIIALVHDKQSEFRYPFLELKEYGNKWKWFYYGSETIQKISNCPFQSKIQSHNLADLFMEDLKSFVHNYRTENLDKEIVDNIQQLHLLQVHNYYKNRFYLQLISIQKCSIYVVLLTIIVILIFIFKYFFICGKRVLILIVC